MTIKVGVCLPQQQCTIEQLRQGWRQVDQAGFDGLWVWDHFFPLHGDPNGSHLEAWSLLAAVACDTSTPQIGTLVSCYGTNTAILCASPCALCLRGLPTQIILA